MLSLPLHANMNFYLRFISVNNEHNLLLLLYTRSSGYKFNFVLFSCLIDVVHVYGKLLDRLFCLNRKMYVLLYVSM